MSMSELRVKVVYRNDTTANWTAHADVVLLKGEAGVEFLDNGQVKIKIGDGVKTWAELPYFKGNEDEVAALVSRVQAIEDDYLKAADKTELSDALNAEITRAQAAEESLQNQINVIMNNPDTEGVINSIEEFTQYINDHGAIAEGFRADIDANTKAISDYEALVAETYETKADASAKLAEAKEYADNLVAPLSDKLANIETGAQVNVINSVDTTQFGLDENKNLTLLDVAMSKVTGLEDALNGKADSATTLAGYGITDAYTKTETEERIQEVLDGLSDTSETAASVAQALEAYKTSNDQRVTELEADIDNKLEGVQMNGADLEIVDKKVNIKSTDIVKATSEVTVAEDGSLGIGEVNVDKLVQTEGAYLILNGGNAAG